MPTFTDRKNQGPNTEGLAGKLGKRQPQRPRYRGEDGFNIDLKNMTSVFVD
jgi:hypothetical protein